MWGGAITLLMKQIALLGGLPFPVRIPNAETREAIAEAHRPENRKTYATVQEMNKDLLHTQGHSGLAGIASGCKCGPPVVRRTRAGTDLQGRPLAGRDPLAGRGPAA